MRILRKRGIGAKKKIEVLKLHWEGRSIKSISLETGVPENRVSEVIKESEEDGPKLLGRRNL